MVDQALDVLIIGAGISGIGAACHLKRECPGKSVAILERRNAIGGTWDLFRYPGIRSDSDMFTFGYSFKPWTEPRLLADGTSIRNYLAETAREHGVDQKIRFGRKVVRADWSSPQKLWTVEVVDEATGKTERYTARFLMSCSGYYNYDAGFRPEFPGEADFRGQIIHPQHWPENLDYRGKRVVVIGSGATAVTLVPSLADQAAHVTMLQRSPTYIMSVPAVDPLSRALQALLPARWAYRLNRARNIFMHRLIYRASRRRPQLMRRLILGMVKRRLEGTGIDMRHFTPDYGPWDQRLCAVPDGDLFNVLRSGKASVATDHIERFTEGGILLKSGEELKADIIVTATGLDVQLLGGMAVSVDGVPVAIRDTMIYKSVLVADVPNAALVVGYTNISWTLKVDIASEYVCRLLNYMDRHGYTTVMAHGSDDQKTEGTVFGDLSAGYLRRAADRLPRQGRSGPWRVLQDYKFDISVLRHGPIEDEVLEFDGQPATQDRAERFPASLSAASGR